MKDAPVADAATYQPLTVRDFAIDADSLTRMSARVEITGAYTFAGQLDELYGTPGDVALAREGAASPVFIPLLTDHASRAFRAAMIDCRSSGAYFCTLTVRGITTKCTVTNLYGVSHEADCVAVEDGGAYSPPPLTPDQIAAMQAAAAAAQQKHAAELAEQVNKWEEAVENCLVNSDFAHRQPASGSISASIGRLLNPAADANRARQLYEVCTSRPWPAGAAVPDSLPPQIESVIDRCMQSSHDWRFCTDNNPPRP